MSARAPLSSALPPPNEARSCMKHFPFLGEGGVRWFLVARGFIMLQGQECLLALGMMCVCPGVEHVNEGTWGVSRELPKGWSEDSGAGRTPRE